MSSFDQIAYPKQTSEWGRCLIDALNTQFENFQRQFDGVAVNFEKVNANIDKVNANIDGQFKALRQDIIEVRAVAESALTLAGKNQDDITDIRSELNNTKKEIAEIKAELRDNMCEMTYCKFNCNELAAENKLLKQHTNKLDNYSRRRNIVIKGIDEVQNESHLVCEQKSRDFMKTQLKLDGAVVDNMKFDGCHRLSVFTNRKRRGQHQTPQNRPVIIRFCNMADKMMVWGAKSQINDANVSVSENFSTDTEYRRNKLYMIYKKAKSIDKYKQKVYLTGDVLIVEGVRYTVDDLHDLPGELNPRLFSERINNDFHAFGGIHSLHNPFSNWYSCKVRHEGHTFKSVEQAYQYCKAKYVDDGDSATKLLYTVDPGAAKKIGSGVAGINGTNWDKDKYQIMKGLVYKKFTENDDLKTELLSTGEKTMVESGRDVHFACGLSITHKDIFNKAKWSGKNKLGDILGAVRQSIRDP